MSSPVVLRLPVVDFKSRSRPRDTSLSDSENKEEKKREKTVATPILVDFDKLLRGPKDVKHERVLTGIPNVDLLHATAALYSVNLPEVTDDIIYTTLLEPKARTLLMVHEEKQAKLRFIRDLKDMKKVKKSSGGNDNIQPKAQATESQQSVTETTDTTDSDDYNQFANVFSDDNTEDEDEEEEEDAEDFMETIDDFLKAIRHRREKAQELAERVRSKKGKPVKSSEVTLGIEKRLFGAMTFERSYERAAQRIFVLTLIAVRKKHKKLGVGHYMLKQLRDSTVSGGADIIIVNADQSAVHFFEKEGFTDDVLINSLYSEIGDAWLNTRRMCRFSSFNGEQVTSCPDKDMRDEEDTSPPELDLKEMELQLKLWKEKSLQSYQTQALLVARMRKEIMTLRARASLQEVTAERLRRELEDTKDGVVDQKETYLRNRMESIRQAVEDFTLFGRGDVDAAHDDDTDSSCSSSAQNNSASSSTSVAELRITHDITVGRRPPTPSKDVTVGRRPPTPSKDVTVGRRSTTPSNDVTIGRQPATPSNDVTFGRRTPTPSNDITFGRRPATPRSRSKSPCCTDTKDRRLTPQSRVSSPQPIVLGRSRTPTPKPKEPQTLVFMTEDTIEYDNKGLGLEAVRRETLASLLQEDERRREVRGGNGDEGDEADVSGDDSDDELFRADEEAGDVDVDVTDVTDSELSAFLNQQTCCSPERDQQRNNEDDDFNHDPNHPGVSRKKQQAEASVEKVLIGRKAESPGTVSQSPGRQRSPSTDRRRTSSTKVDRVSPTMRPAMSSPTPQPKPARTPSLSSPKPQSQTSPRSQSPRQQSPIQQSAFSPQRGMAPKPQPQRSSSVVGRSSSAAGKPFIPRPVAATSLDARQKWAVSEQMADFARREIEHCFKTSMDGDGTAVPTQVMSIEPAQPTDEMYAKFDTKVREAHSPDIVGELYFCAKEGGASDARLHHVTNFGFSDFDFAESAYGRGLHFTRYARTAARYSPPNKVLVAKVLLGRTKTVTEKDEARTDAPAGCDSILTQGRMSTIATKPGRQYRPGCSEYIVFHPDQALPVAVIKYAADGAST